MTYRLAVLALSTVLSCSTLAAEPAPLVSMLPADFVAHVQQLAKANPDQTPTETMAEYAARRESMAGQTFAILYDFRLDAPVMGEAMQYRQPVLSYNADTETMTLALIPGMTSLFEFNPAIKNAMDERYSDLVIERQHKKTHGYVGQTALGIKAPVIKSLELEHHLVVVDKRLPNGYYSKMTPHPLFSARWQVPREDAQSVLDEAKLKLEGRIEWMMSSKKLVAEDAIIIRPSIDDPRHVDGKKYSITAHLSKVSVVDGKGNVLADATIWRDSW